MELATFSRPGAVVIKSEGTVISSLDSAKNNYDARRRRGQRQGRRRP